MSQPEKRAQFSTRLGVIATTVGSAVGLGNIWRFPYEAGIHGGGAFLILYIFFIFLIGIPVICAEFIMGRSTRKNIFGAFRSLSNQRQWAWIGYMGILASILILSFYSVVAGWTVEYFVQSLTGALSNMTPEQHHARFDSFSSGIQPVLWTLIFLSANAMVLLRGVQNGIEKISNILMPLLLLILIAFCINSLLMPGASEGLKFLFYPDFSKINSSVLIGALGQAFFSLSLGLGTMMIYSSYFSNETPLVKSATTTATLDTIVAIMAGVIIFPAVFTFHAEPAAGPKLVFEILPSIFHSLPFGAIWSTLFFFLLMIASLTSTISMSEMCIAFFIEQLHLKRRTAVLLNTTVAMILGTICALSFGPLSDYTIFGLTTFNLFDYVTSNIFLPLGGMLISVFVGWKADRHIVRNQLAGSGTIKTWLLNSVIFCLKFVAPTGIGLVFISGLNLI
ncbi:MAG: sodium-dependent transporter [Muribaculum sp.]|nr:sodium-dependent transporter [Muribaculaceae bacterium]MCM1080590.1 sodium-dependent transporter [Muribaculum sp.]